MKPCPAIALLELSTITAGIKTADAMVKKSPIALLKTGTVSRGKYLVLVGGSIASVDEAFREGLAVAGNACLAKFNLPDVHPRCYTAMLGEKMPVIAESLGILETSAIAATIEAADKAIKGAEVAILEMRLGEHYGGKGYVLFNGRIEDVQLAMEIAAEVSARKKSPAEIEIIPLLHEATAKQIGGPLRFGEALSLHLPDGEQDVTG